MTTTRGKWLLVIGLVAAALAALALGASPGTLLLVGVALLCPAAMYFGMSGMGAHGGGCGHSAKCEHGEARGAEGATKDDGRRMAA